MHSDQIQILRFDQLRRSDISSVGGKNASLGELISELAAQGVPVPPGFATTAAAYWDFVDANALRGVIGNTLDSLKNNEKQLAEAGRLIRNAFLKSSWPAATEQQIRRAYRELGSLVGRDNCAVAVRSSATAEDLPDASFAGQQESFLNIRGEQDLLDACKRCYSSLFTDRAIMYREAKGFDHSSIALSVGVQQMVRSDLGSSGVMFSIDTETGFDKVVVINAAWGLGDNVVQGTVDPDEYQVFKPLLANSALAPIIEMKLGSKEQKLVYSDRHPTRNVDTSAQERNSFALQQDEVLLLARWACLIEQHYGCPMDTEWAKDGESGNLYIVQARPETVQSRKSIDTIRSYRLIGKKETLLSGLAIGNDVVTASVCVIPDIGDIGRFIDGSILVTENTNPDWVPVMKRAAAIITNHGGRTSHAAIVSRELGVPAIIGTGRATEVLAEHQEVTVSCAEGDEGFVYRGLVEFTCDELDISKTPATKTNILLNMANPAAAFRWWRVPADGIGLARMEFVISNHVRVHPMALAHYEDVEDPKAREEIESLTRAYADRTDYFVERLAVGLARIAAVFYPKPAIIRMSDFKTNEYANLLGGRDFEPKEENPMLGFRGASRYYSPRYKEGFALECRAICRLRDVLGFKNVIVMIPFCRTVGEADQVLATMKENGLVRDENQLEIYMMCEIPANVVLAKSFATRFDGFSIGSNDLTQLTLGVDRDSAELAALFDERDAAVEWMIQHVIDAAHSAETRVGLCGQAPSDHPGFADFLVHCGIDSISVSPDSFFAVKTCVAVAESKLSGSHGHDRSKIA